MPVAFRGHVPVVAADVFVAPGVILLGDVAIGPGSSIWYGCVLRGDINAIRIGARSNLQDGTVVHVSGEEGGSTEIGDDVTVGHMALLHACTLEDGSFVGMKACVMDGAVVETGAVVAAGAVVTPDRRIPAGELWAGCPARLLRPLSNAERADFAATAARYAAIAREYLAAGLDRII
jgi:carbonic anhydrase/acetyltransferase-like protein (isoleucine patch superfamily)